MGAARPVAKWEVTRSRRRYRHRRRRYPRRLDHVVANVTKSIRYATSGKPTRFFFIVVMIYLKT